MSSTRVVGIGSIFRNSAAYIRRYFDQLSGLASMLSAQDFILRPLLVEGDSTDRTYGMLVKGIGAYASGAVIKRDHGGPVFGSVDVAQRWSQLAHACNGVLEAVTPDLDALIYVESDLLWKPETMVRLLDLVGVFDNDCVPAVAPWCFTAPQGLSGPRGFFYDIWGHIGADGVNFTTHTPHHADAPEFDESGARPLVPINSAGSCVVVGKSVVSDIIAGTVRFSNVDCIRGYCRDINATQRDTYGHGLYLDPGAEVRHP